MYHILTHAESPRSAPALAGELQDAYDAGASGFFMIHPAGDMKFVLFERDAGEDYEVLNLTGAEPYWVRAKALADQLASELDGFGDFADALANNLRDGKYTFNCLREFGTWEQAEAMNKAEGVE